MTYPLTLEFTIQRQIQMNWIELTINSYLKLNSYQKQIKKQFKYQTIICINRFIRLNKITIWDKQCI